MFVETSMNNSMYHKELFNQRMADNILESCKAILLYGFKGLKINYYYDETPLDEYSILLHLDTESVHYVIRISHKDEPKRVFEIVKNTILKFNTLEEIINEYRTNQS